MLDIEIDGKQIKVPEGSSIMDAAQQVGAYIPHFCYHKKLSIAASCRMCLVQVEKAPKALPACATPVTNGMKVFTHSALAVKAQKSVMEFLLINHPLDCPVCDQGGECQLQDLSVGYGADGSRYQEEKRVVVNKNLGALISTDMTRCIHCTRCVRFGQEIAGVMELGCANRNEHAEIMPFLSRTVDSELSGNMIDLCPVGALTSKPFRFGARSWEMQRRRTVSPHDGLGANQVAQIKHNKVLRVVPFENDDVNECWLSDKDRFAYEGLNSKDRLTVPMVKQGGEWKEVPWNVALDYAAHALRDVASEQGGDQIGALLSPHATVEELSLAARLVRALGSDNVDFRLRRQDFSSDSLREGVPSLGMTLAELSEAEAVLVVGGFLRKDQPLVAQRLRQSAKIGMRVSRIVSADDDWLLPLDVNLVAAPSQVAGLLAEVAVAAAEVKNESLAPAIAKALAGVKAGEGAMRIAQQLAEGEQAAVLLGNAAQQQNEATALWQLAAEVARLTGARLGFLGEAANSVGGYVAKALPQAGGLNARAMLTAPRKAYVLLNVEPEFDTASPALASQALKSADTVVALTTFKSDSLLDVADVLLPVAPYTETAGSFINMEGRIQSFNGVVTPAGEARPGWKVLRVLANVIGLNGFQEDSIEAVRAGVLTSGDFAEGMSNAIAADGFTLPQPVRGLQRVGEIPIHAADPIVRRAPALQRTQDAAVPKARLHAEDAAALGISSGDKVIVSQGGAALQIECVVCPSVPKGAVRVAGACELTAGLGDLYGDIKVERA